MGNKLKFNKIRYKNVFCEEFNDFKQNNVLDFKKNIVILYGPNGTGKTSLSKVLGTNNQNEDMEFDVEFKGMQVGTNNEIFHIISDQNSRNIIKGEAKDYLIGDNIEREETLSKDIEDGFDKLYTSMKSKLKDIFKITIKSHKLLDTVQDSDIKGFISNFANSKFKSENIDREKYITKVSELKEIESLFDKDDDKYKFIMDNYKDNRSIIYKVLSLNIKDINANSKIKEIEENEDAINILNKFAYKHECIVCDNKDYDKDKLLKSKQENKSNIEKCLDEKTKNILNGIIKIVKEKHADPFNIEQILLESIKTGETEKVKKLQEEIENHLDNISKELYNLLIQNLDSDLVSKYNEHKKIIESQIEISEEDILYLEEIISENIGKEIKVDRDEHKKIRITLDGSEFLGKERDELELSTGQQNFISLSFELLKAKKSQKPYIVLDDPISSFDSIYKNKIAFCIVKFLEGRKQIILTHNTELIKLLEFQAKNSFELYLFNNTVGCDNGFIKVNDEEQEILLQLNKLLDLCRANLHTYIYKGNSANKFEINRKRFFISMIPFMRGYANIIGSKDTYKNLCKVMHGYEFEYVNIGGIYKELFKVEVEDLNISVKEILEFDLGNDEIIDKSKYPLLNRTLYHTLNYLVLRLLVEQTLCSLENNKVLNEIEKGKQKQGEKYPGMTTQKIIDKVFNRNDKTKTEERVFFTSRKTLLNEFNHFEGNMNIFQPAIDITDKALQEEKTSILRKIEVLRENDKNNFNSEVAVTL